MNILCKLFGHKIYTLRQFGIDKVTKKWNKDYFVDRCKRHKCKYKKIRTIPLKEVNHEN